jgi:hypothetical protein
VFTGVGYDGSNRLNDFYEFNFTRKLWSIVPAAGLVPSPRDRHVGVVYKDSFYVFAGFDGSSRINDFMEYNFCPYRFSLSERWPANTYYFVSSDAEMEYGGCERWRPAHPKAQSLRHCLW